MGTAEIYQLCPTCKGTGKHPRAPKRKCSGCEDGLILWGYSKDAPEKKAKK